jgi:uncharacterized Zn-binding protein involved in type VI secretion
MAMRKNVCVGDPPTTGGAVLPNNSTYSLGDSAHPVAMIGDKVQCASCGQIGHIAKIGGTRRLNWMGKEIALEGDLCICRCHHHL